MNGERSGSCLCGAVRFTVQGALRDVVFCHCSQCRRQTGHFYAATNVPDERIRIEGGENLTWYAASDTAKRGFCRTCGSALFWKQNEASEVSVMAGAFDLPSGLRGGHHLFVADKGDYYEIADGLVQHDESTPKLTVDGS